MGFATWAAQFCREETLVQTLNEDRAAHLIDYVRQLWDNQEGWLKARHPLNRRSGFAIAWAGGGEVAAIASGADKIRRCTRLLTSKMKVLFSRTVNRA
jgi:hypothetical protein